MLSCRVKYDTDTGSPHTAGCHHSFMWEPFLFPASTVSLVLRAQCIRLSALHLHPPVSCSLMSREHLPLQALLAWIGINNATLSNVEVRPINHKGNGLVAQKDSADIKDSPVLTIPRGLVLDAAAVAEYAKEDKNFSQLLRACGRKVSIFSLIPRTILINARVLGMMFSYSCWSS